MGGITDRIAPAVAILGLMAGAAGPARADLYVVDPDALPAGSDITNAFPDVKLSAIYNQTSVDVLSLTSVAAAPSTGTRVFGHVSPFEQLWNNAGRYDLKAEFVAPVDYVQIDIISDDNFDLGKLIAYDGAGVQIGFVTSPALEGIGQYYTASISRPEGDIASIIASGANSEAVLLDNLRFHVASVPEPSALVSAVIGLVGLGALSCHCRKATSTA